MIVANPLIAQWREFALEELGLPRDAELDVDLLRVIMALADSGYRPPFKPEQHWLVFDKGRQVTGCHCGFRANIDSDRGYGDSVVAHLQQMARDEAVEAFLAAPVTVERTTRTILQGHRAEPERLEVWAADLARRLLVALTVTARSEGDRG